MISKQDIVNLYRKTATEVPMDILNALKDAEKSEIDSMPKNVLRKIIENSEIAQKEAKPICQDTGTPIFYIQKDSSLDEKRILEVIEEATQAATKEIPLRNNAVDSLTNKDYGNKPLVYFEHSGLFKMDLMMKGGGSENITQIYSLPNKELNANRDLNGVEKCILDAVFKAQGKGCPPYIIGVALGGTVGSVAHLSKKELLRNVEDKNEELHEFEKRVLKNVNQLGIGPLGLGGKTTALAVKMCSSHRHPASFFVGISFGCWCLRRQSL